MQKKQGNHHSANIIVTGKNHQKWLVEEKLWRKQDIYMILKHHSRRQPLSIYGKGPIYSNLSDTTLIKWYKLTMLIMRYVNIILIWGPEKKYHITSTVFLLKNVKPEFNHKEARHNRKLRHSPESLLLWKNVFRRNVFCYWYIEK